MSAEWIEALKKENEQLKKELEEYKHILDSNLANIHPDSVVITEKEYMRLLSVESDFKKITQLLMQVKSKGILKGIDEYNQVVMIAEKALGDE